jgi:pimeloyl-ACP methyl ester carboxylesterase
MGPRRRPAAEASEPFAVQQRVIHGHRRAYRTGGDTALTAGGTATPDGRPTLLLLHGVADSSESWLPVMPGLAEHFRVIAPDLLGHGHSDKPRADYSAAAFANGMRDLLDVLDVDRVTVIGHSLGGGVAAQFAYQYPERVERLVLVSTGGVDREVSPLLRLVSAPLSELVVPLVHTPPGRLLARVALSLANLVDHDLAKDAPEIRRILEALPADGAFDAFTRTLRAVVDWRGQVVTMRDRVYLAETIPMAIMWGTNDAIIPVDHAERLHAAAPHARFSLYLDAGHFPHHAEPRRFVEEIVDFVSSTEPAHYDEELFRRYLRTGSPDAVDLRDGSGRQSKDLRTPA